MHTSTLSEPASMTLTIGSIYREPDEKPSQKTLLMMVAKKRKAVRVNVFETPGSLSY